jgi:hypothetical protein
MTGGYTATTSRERAGVARRLTFVLLCSACLILAVGYAVLAMRQRAVAAGAQSAGISVTDGLILPAGRPAVLFRGSGLDADYGKVALTPLDDASPARRITALSCDRVDFAARVGLCLAIDRGVFTTARALIFDEQFQVRREISLKGIPSRARLSPDGRYGATTTFVSGHSYADGTFSTETTLIDIATAASLGTLEELSVWREGARIHAPDFNFWGVTFANDGDRFYATLAAGGKTYLVVGSIVDRSVEVIHENVECPSLSPDQTRVAFKRRVSGSGPIQWQPYVLDLVTLTETPLPEARSIDDQIEWLDSREILYALPESSPSAVTHVWSLAADGSGEPRMFLEQAASPAVIRSLGALAGP